VPVTSKSKLACLLVSGLVFAFVARASDSSPQTFDEAKRTFRDFKVESPEEFSKIKQHYLKALSQGRLTRQFRTANGQLIHCIEIGSQDSVKRAGLAPGRIPTGPQIPPAGDGSGSEPTTGSAADFGMDGSLDPDGNVRRCPAGSVPIVIPSLESLCHFRKLEDLFEKYPPGHTGVSHPAARHAPGSSSNGQKWQLPTAHEYGYAYSFFDNQGEAANFNLWKPAVEQTDEFSLSQLWVFNGSFSDLQTAETGWQVYNDKYGDWQPHLFIFTTQNGYTPPDPGYYNLDPGSPFIQTDSSVIIAGALTPVSAYGGTQYDITLSFYRDAGGTHDWWFKFNNKWVGYYPNNWFDSAGLADKSGGIEYGGEIVNDNLNGVHTTTQMGSGHFPSEGFQHSAYTRRIKYYDTSYVLQDANNLSTSASDNNYYDIALFSDGDTNWLNYFYFGGPGRVPPVSDFCSNAVVLADGVTYSTNTFGATDDASSCAGTTTRGVWFTFTPSQSGLATVDTCGSDYQTAVEVMTGICGNFTSVACNVGSGPLCPGLLASVTFNAVAGTKYYICAGGYSGSYGNLQVRAGLHRPVIDPTLAGAASGNVQIAWTSLAGVNYQLQYKTNLNDSIWRVLSNIQATGTVTTVQDPTAPLPKRRFYRVMVQ
jgi:hypothetical protein